jgi:hypothetical protein
MRMREIEQRVLTALRQRLLAPDAVATAVEAYRIERQRLSRERARDRSALELEISEVGRQIDRMIASIKDGVDPKLLVADLNNAHAKREALQRQLRLLTMPVLPSCAHRPPQPTRRRLSSFRKLWRRETLPRSRQWHWCAAWCTKSVSPLGLTAWTWRLWATWWRC